MFSQYSFVRMTDFFSLASFVGADFLGAMGAVAPIQMGSVGVAHSGKQAQANSRPNFYKVLILSLRN